MKTLLRIIPSIFVMAFSLPSNAMLNDYTSKQLSDFIKKKGQCQFAVGQTNMTIQQMADSIQKDEAKWPMNPWVLCVDDMVQGKGTIKEKSGCALYYFNVESGEASMFRKELGSHLMADKTCSSGGFDDLLKLKAPLSTPYDKFANFDYNPTKGMVPVSTWLTDQGHSAFGVSGRVLLYSKKSGWEDWWNKERGQVKSGWAKLEADKEKKIAQKKSEEKKDLKKSKTMSPMGMYIFCRKKHWTKDGMEPSTTNTNACLEKMIEESCRDENKNVEACVKQKKEEEEKINLATDKKARESCPYIDGDNGITNIDIDRCWFKIYQELAGK